MWWGNLLTFIENLSLNFEILWYVISCCERWFSCVLCGFVVWFRWLTSSMRNYSIEENAPHAVRFRRRASHYEWRWYYVLWTKCYKWIQLYFFCSIMYIKLSISLKWTAFSIFPARPRPTIFSHFSFHLGVEEAERDTWFVGRKETQEESQKASTNFGRTNYNMFGWLPWITRRWVDLFTNNLERSSTCGSLIVFICDRATVVLNIHFNIALR